MPTINPSLVPTIAPGNLFAALTGDSTLNVRWITPTDPVYYESVNRPIADVVLRQLILAKTLDQLSVSIGHQAIFPFLIQAKVISMTSEVDLPYGWIWDLHISAPAKWNNFRLAKIKRLNGEQAGTSDYTGVLRLVFTAAQSNTSSDQPIDTATEVAIFYADYVIDSLLTYQRSRIIVVDSTEESSVTTGIAAINPGEKETINGFITFRTLIQSDPIVQTFYNAIPYVTPPGNVYPIASTAPNGFDDFSTLNVVHGTGILVDSCYNAIPQMDSDAQTWLNAFNYPFEISSTRTSSTPISVTIPLGLFNEFNIVAPASDQPTGDTSGLYYPVWISKIQTIGTKADTLLFFFSTYNTTQTASGLA